MDRAGLEPATLRMPCVRPACQSGGPEEIRTLNLFNAIEARYHYATGPKKAAGRSYQVS